jgi:FtsH-binding integral membrane protein
MAPGPITQGAADMESPITEVIAVMIPIVAIVMGIGIGMLGLLLDYRKKREMFAMHHQERMAAIDKGMEVPPLPPEFFQDARRRRTPADSLRRGLVLLFLGAAITGALYVSARGVYLWGLVPAAIGAALLLFYFIEGRKAPRE